MIKCPTPNLTLISAASEVLGEDVFDNHACKIRFGRNKSISVSYINTKVLEISLYFRENPFPI